MFITYKFCGCSATIMAKLSAILKPECDKTLGVSALAKKTVKGYKDSTIKEPHLFCNHAPGFDDFSILAFNNYDKHSLPLELFDYWETYVYHMIAGHWSDYSFLIPHKYCFIKWMVFYW